MRSSYYPNRLCSYEETFAIIYAPLSYCMDFRVSFISVIDKVMERKRE